MTQQHHPFGPSRLDGLAACPHYSPGPSSEAADYGTTIHKIANGELPESATDDAGREMLEYWREIIGSVQGLKEHRLTLIDEAFNEVLFGTADFVTVDAGAAHVYDLKTGQPHAYRLQMMAYAAAAMQTYSVDHAWITLVFARGRFTQDSEFRDLPALIAEIRPVIAAGQNPGELYIPCDFCGWCGLRETCPALTQTAMAVAKSYGPSDLVLPEYHSSAISDPIEMAKALTVARVVKGWCESVEEHAKNMALTGGELPGFKLCERKANARITDMQNAFELSGLKLEEFLPCTSVQLSKLVAAVGRARGLKASQAKKAVEEELSLVIQRGEPTRYLRKTTDKGDDNVE